MSQSHSVPSASVPGPQVIAETWVNSPRIESTHRTHRRQRTTAPATTQSHYVTKSLSIASSMVEFTYRSTLASHKCHGETLAVMYLQRGPPIAENKPTTHRTHRTQGVWVHQDIKENRLSNTCTERMRETNLPDMDNVSMWCEWKLLLEIQKRQEWVRADRYLRRALRWKSVTSLGRSHL